jgi:hydroxylamine dehydrogenase
MKHTKWLAAFLLIAIASLVLSACGSQPALVENESEYNTTALSDEALTCVECHATETHGIVADWDGSRHAVEGVSCIDCHQVDADSPLVLKEVEGHDDVTTPLSMLVTPVICAECHEARVAQFDASGHYRAALQVEAKDGMQLLMNVQEGQSHPEFSGAPEQTGCMQCHGVRIVVDDTGHPTTDTFPTSGMGNIYPGGEVGNCTVCHTRHSFDIAEARKPEACGSCHIGPDHPDLEIFQNSKHGQIYYAEGDEWVWDSAPGEWEPGDYRAPTCATCHMSGIGDLTMTHNVSERLYWNLWAKASTVRNSVDPMSPLTGDGVAGRQLMESVCSECHSTTFTTGFFKHGDDAIHLYNVAYFAPADKMFQELKDKDLLKADQWTDEFQVLYYYLWHHEGRRARQGSLMGGPDWAHWHGFFELQQDLAKMTEIYNMRIESGVIE